MSAVSRIHWGSWTVSSMDAGGHSLVPLCMADNAVCWYCCLAQQPGLAPEGIQMLGGSFAFYVIEKNE